MKYKKPNMSVIFIEDENIITTSPDPSPLLPDIDGDGTVGDGNLDITD